jgi:hypothetical protein
MGNHDCLSNIGLSRKKSNKGMKEGSHQRLSSIWILASLWVSKLWGTAPYFIMKLPADTIANYEFFSHVNVLIGVNRGACKIAIISKHGTTHKGPLSSCQICINDSLLLTATTSIIMFHDATTIAIAKFDQWNQLRIW